MHVVIALKSINHTLRNFVTIIATLQKRFRIKSRLKPLADRVVRVKTGIDVFSCAGSLTPVNPQCVYGLI